MSVLSTVGCTVTGTVKLVRDAANLPSMGTQPSHYRGYRFPPEIISYAVWLYHRFCLSFRNVEEILARAWGHREL